MQDAIDAIELLRVYPEGGDCSGSVESVALNPGHPTHDAVARLIDRWPDPPAPREVLRRWCRLKPLSRVPKPKLVYLNRLARKLAWCIASVLLPKLPEPVHSSDFRSVNWYGTVYEFTPTQAAIIAVLWPFWQRGTPFVSEAYVLEAIASNAQRIHPTFQRNAAWGVMVGHGESNGSVGLISRKTP